SRPEGNITGVTSYSSALVAKHLELLHELVPKAATIAVLVNPTTPAAEIIERDIQTVAPMLGRRIHIVHASSARELDAAFATLAEVRTAAVVVGADPFFDSQLERIVAAAALQRLPATYHLRKFVEIGGLLSYSTSSIDVYRQAGVYAGRILRGAKPSDL